MGREMSTKKMVMAIMGSPDRTQEIVDLFVAHAENSKWAKSNLVELIGKFPDSYVAVRSKEVVMHDKSLLRLIKRLRTRFGDISDITIEHVTNKPIKLLL